VDQKWAARQLAAFSWAIDNLVDRERTRGTWAGNERETLRVEREIEEAESEIRTLEPVAQIVMDAVLPGLSGYERPEDSDAWPIRWRPAKSAALRALGLVTNGAEAKERVRPDAPELVADRLHIWVWEPARPMLAASSYATAVLHAAQSVNSRLQQKLGRHDISDAKLVTEAFSLEAPKPGRPRLRFGGDRTSETWRSLQEGSGAFGRGCFQAVRNPIAHDHRHPVSEQEALEQLAALSVLARWIDSCAVES
jgi:uncharacterized protein (TIGR02391 family)